MSAEIVAFPVDVQQDAAKFLGAVVEGLDSGVLPPVIRGVLIIHCDDGSMKIWGFGP